MSRDRVARPPGPLSTFRASGRVAARVALVSVAGCADGPTTPGPGGSCVPTPPARLASAAPVDLSRPWEVVSPMEVGVDDCALDHAVAAAAAIPRFRSLVAARDGRIFLEEYFGGQNVAALNDVRSVTKSVVATLAAVALRRGFLGSLDDPIGDHVSPSVATLEPGQAAITVRDLLTMTGGFQWDESGGFGDYSAWIQSSDHLRFLLDRPLASSPGTRFTYNSAAVHLLGVVLEGAVGEPLPEFAARELFDPLGIGPVQWEPLSGGHVNGGAGIDLRARDLARLGQLYLQDGVSGGSRILPEGWVAGASAPAFPWRARYGPLDSYTYGRLWWVSDGEPEAAFLAWGWGGQYVYVVPDLDLVVVATTDWRQLSREGGPVPLEQAGLGVIIDGIHSAVAGRGGAITSPAASAAPDASAPRPGGV